MKADRGGSFQRYRREYSVERPPHDPYRATEKLPEPTRCPSCKATWIDGRWTWQKAPADANEEMCPACQRIEDRFPAGYVTLQGSFQAEHRDEIVNLVTAKEAREKAEHPLQRIMGMEDVSAGLQISTTDSHLARGIGEALEDAYDGVLKIRYSKDENLVRVTWKR